MYACCDDSFSCCHVVVPEKAKVPKGRGRKENLGRYLMNFMTEESDDSEGEGFRQHPLQWRSSSELLWLCFYVLFKLV